MVRGKLYNWTVEPVYHGQEEPFGYAMHVGDMGEMYQALYHPDEKILSFTQLMWESDGVYRFYCETLWEAEIMMKAFLKANDIDITDMIYDKQAEKS